MNKIDLKDNVEIENLIYEVRGKQVMLDSDLAKFYGCKNGTKEINQAVKRNSKRFPNDFYFQLTKDEYDNLKSQIVTSNWNTYGGVRKLPYVFTEQGVAMLSSVLKTEIASIVSVNIMRAFVAMRKYIASNNYDNRLSNLETKYIDHDNKIDLILDKLDNSTPNNHIFFEGQIYDAYSLMMDILSLAKKEIIIIDNYAGKELFDLLKDVKAKIKVYSKNFNEELILKYNSQYNNITPIIHSGFHDRFIILDESILYHCGSSFKDLGKKCFAINKIDNFEILGNIIKKL